MYIPLEAAYINMLKKSLNISKVLSETVNRRKTDNTMVKTKKDKRTNNDLQSTTQKTKDRPARTSLKPGMNSGAPDGLAVPAPLVTPVLLL